MFEMFGGECYEWIYRVRNVEVRGRAGIENELVSRCMHVASGSRGMTVEAARQ